MIEYILTANRLNEAAAISMKATELEKDLNSYIRQETILRHVLETTSRVTGAEFLQLLVCRLADALNMRYAYITECDETTVGRVKTLAVWTGSEFGQNFEYDVMDTPCKDVINGNVCYIPDNIQKKYPRDLILAEWNAGSYVGIPIRDKDGKVKGHLAVLDENVAHDEAFILNVLHVFALRAESEMQRMQDDRRIAEQIDRYKESEAELKKKKEELEKVNAIVSAINSELNAKDLLQSVLEHTKFIQGVDKTTAILYDKNSGAFRLTASTDPEINKELHIELTPAEAHARYVEGNEEVYDDIYIISHVKGRCAEHKVAHLGLPASILAMRITIQEAVTGYLIFNNMNDQCAFDYQDIRLLALLKSHIHSALIKIRMLEELTDLNGKKNEFLGMAAHDLRNPLQCLSGYISMMITDIRQEKLDPDSTLMDLECMRKSTLRMGRMLDELLDISAIESGQIRLEMEYGNLQSILSESIEMHQRHAQQKNIKLSIDRRTQVPNLYFDRTRMIDVVDNLLNNAIKYTASGGSVDVTFQVWQGSIVMRVSDTGLGLDETDLKEIFRSFKKLSAKPTGGETSTGLGLLIVKKILDKHGGSIQVESRKGVGSTFSISLPLTRHEKDVL
ncbi:HAMP domain-containing histidine kinase [bacterium]|nr:MAG: HAMP domain-containing histidine kinase [bacterium]